MEEHTQTLAGPAAELDQSWGEYGRRLQFLKRVPLFAYCSESVLRHLVVGFKPRRVAEGSIVCREGERADEFFLVESGTLAVTVQVGGAARAVGRLGPGEFFGEQGLLARGPRTATVRAETAARLWSLSFDDFHELLSRDADVALAVADAARRRAQSRLRDVFEVEQRNLAALADRQRRIRIGRGSDNDLIFGSRLVSRHHATLDWTGNGYRLRDLGSANGTFVNGRPVSAAQLADGDEIWVADEHFIFDQVAIKRCLEPRGIRIDATDLCTIAKGGKQLLHNVTLTVLPGEFVAIVGGSGAGKTTLMDALSGVRPATSGSLRYNSRDFYQTVDLFRAVLGYVPQDDIIHTALPLQRTLLHAARLRLPPDTAPEDRDRAVDEAIEELGLQGQGGTRVRALSGGQRKRASMGVEVLSHPRVFFLDEPTSGLDPATDTQMMHLLRRIADEGSTVVVTTHATKNVRLCDKVVFLARGGHLAFVGSPQRALRHFAVEEFDEVYERLSNEATPEEWGERFRASEDWPLLLTEQSALPTQGEQPDHERKSLRGRAPGLRQQVHQFVALTRRGVELLAHYRPNLIALFALPLAIAILLLALFNGGLFSLTSTNPAATVQILLAVAYGELFFGVSYGLNEISKEFPIFARERMVNLGVLPYVLSKVCVLGPILLIVGAVMVGLLRLTARLPDTGVSMYAPLYFTIALTGLAGLTLGLFASASVSSPEMGTRIITLLLLPQALFSGGFVAISAMNVVGQWISNVMVLRWSFEAVGHQTDVSGLFAHSSSPIGRPLLAQYSNTFSRSSAQDWAILGAFIVVPFILTCLTLRRRTAR